jgi:hypothetical protein
MLIDMKGTPAAVVHFGVWAILCGTFVQYIPMSTTAAALSSKELIVSLFLTLNFRNSLLATVDGISGSTSRLADRPCMHR